MSEFAIEDQIFADYIDYKAAHSNQSPIEVTAQLDRDKFYEHVYSLHDRFIAGEFSLGYMAQLLDITKSDLYHLLDAMGLKVTNV